MSDIITLEMAVELSKPIAKKIFNEKIKPFLGDKFTQYLKTKSEANTFEKESVKYIARSTGQCSIMNTIAFPNTPKKLKELYLPLTIRSDNDSESGMVIDDDADIFKNHSKVLVNDTAGMGKSTLSKKTYLNIINEEKYIPVFIELRQLEKQPIAVQIAKKFGVSTDSPNKLLSKLPLVYLFDGLDEVSDNDKNYIVTAIRNFIDELDNPKILITSRQESYLSEFYDFTRYTIKPLVEEEAFDLISRYDPIGKVSKKLISGIQQSNDLGLKEFLSTPLYVSLLFCSYRHKTVIPQKKHLFYSQVYEALFDSHDLSKEIGFVRPKNSNLDSSEFHILLRRLAFWCLTNGGKIEFQKDELEIIIHEIISDINGINTSAVNFVKDLTTKVPLFLKEGSNLRWSHKSLMEYFSSMFICFDTKDKQQDILLHLYQSNEWSSYINIFDLCSDIDFSSFRASIVKKVLEDFVNYHDSNYQNITNTRIKHVDIEKRIGLSFCMNFGFKMLKGKHNDKSFWNDTDPDLSTFKNKFSAIDNEINKIMLLIPADGLLYGTGSYSRRKIILEILKRKAPQLFPDRLNSEEVDLTILMDILNNSPIKWNEFHIVSDDPTVTINNSKYFNAMNKLMSMFGVQSLDYSTVKNELKNINVDSSNGIDKLIGILKSQN